MSITCAADFADWYDTVARNYADTALTEFVDRNPGLFGVHVAGSAGTLFDLSSIFFVDLARLGQGAAQGTAGGVFTDVLRVLSATPPGKMASLVGSVARPVAGKVLNAVDRIYWAGLKGKLCVPISLSQALQRTGQLLVVELDAVLKAMGRDLASFDRATGHGANISELRTALQNLKAAFTELSSKGTSSWNDLVRLAEANEGVLMIPLTRTIRTGNKVKDTRHYVTVSKTRDGVVIIDRKGVFTSLEELSRRYGSANPAEFYKVHQNASIFVISNWAMDPALVARLDKLGPLGAIVVKAAMTIGFNPAVSRAQVEQRFADFAKAKSPEELYDKPVMPPDMPASMYLHEVGAKIEKKDWLSVIAERWYGDQLLWPIIFDFNRTAEFSHPKKMKPFMRIKVPFLPPLTQAERAAVRKRGLDWR